MAFASRATKEAGIGGNQQQTSLQPEYNPQQAVLRRRKRNSNSRSHFRGSRLILAEEKELQVDQSGLRRRQFFSRGPAIRSPLSPLVSPSRRESPGVAAMEHAV